MRTDDLLLVVDVQNDFCPGGSLAIPAGNEVVPVINQLANRFEHIACTQDWHPADHLSFASSHPAHAPFETIDVAYGRQVLWPDHCIQGSPGARFHPGLEVDRRELVIRKGFRRDIDSYSAFYENDHCTRTGLSGFLRDRGFTRLFLCGLATDFCVAWSALDARRDGFQVVVIENACRAIDFDHSLQQAKTAMREAGVGLASAAEIA